MVESVRPERTVEQMLVGEQGCHAFIHRLDLAFDWILKLRVDCGGRIVDFFFGEEFCQLLSFFCRPGVEVQLPCGKAVLRTPTRDQSDRLL